MHIAMPKGAQFLTVEFALTGVEPGTTVRQRIVANKDRVVDIIATALRGLKRRKVANVGNMLRITHKGALLFEREGFIPGGFR